MLPETVSTVALRTVPVTATSPETLLALNAPVELAHLHVARDGVDREVALEPVDDDVAGDGVEAGVVARGRRRARSR